MFPVQVTVYVPDFVSPDRVILFGMVIVNLSGSHFAYNILSPVAVESILSIGFPVKFSLSYHPANIYPSFSILSAVGNCNSVPSTYKCGAV